MAKKKKGLDALRDLTGNKDAAKKAVDNLNSFYEKTQSQTQTSFISDESKSTSPQKKTTSKRGKGRPPVEHGRKRFTTLISPEKRDFLKMVALKENCTISDLFEEAADLLIKKYKSKHPNI